jgi:hypothetical protein
MTTTNRLPMPSLNGTHPEGKKVPAPKKTRQPKKAETPKHDDHLGRYAMAGVVTMSIMSAGLNGYAHSLHASVTWAGWALGLIIPVVILLLGKVAGIAYKRDRKTLAYCTAGAGIGLLVLSIWHCTASIALLTGSPLLLAAPMAIAIDAGFVCCELAVIEAETK